MSTDNLDSLPDAQLDEAFIREVCGWEWSEGSTTTMFPACWYNEHGNPVSPTPKFCGSVDAVLPWLEKYEGFWLAKNDVDEPGNIGVCLTMHHPPRKTYAIAPTFAKAAVICLLRARRAEKGAQS